MNFDLISQPFLEQTGYRIREEPMGHGPIIPYKENHNKKKLREEQERHKNYLIPSIIYIYKFNSSRL